MILKKIFLILVLFPALLISQKTYNVDGVVKDKNTGTEIENANVTAKPSKRRSGGGYYTGELTKENGLFKVRTNYRYPLKLVAKMNGCGEVTTIIKKEGFYEILLDCDKQTIKKIIFEQNPPPVLDVKLEDGSLLSAKSLKTGSEIYSMVDGKRIYLSSGEYILDNFKSISVNNAGVITEIKEIIIDIDEDGVLDENDVCPNEAGSVANSGCPNNPKELVDILDKKRSLILFNIDSSEINLSAISLLSNLSIKLKKYSNTSLLVSGHASMDGSVKYNQKLSEARASAVKQAIVLNGIDSQRIKTIGFGETMPIKGNSLVQNRRVVISIE